MPPSDEAPNADVHIDVRMLRLRDRSTLRGEPVVDHGEGIEFHDGESSLANLLRSWNDPWPGFRRGFLLSNEALILARRAAGVLHSPEGQGKDAPMTATHGSCPLRPARTHR